MVGEIAIGKNATILVIDDNEKTREICKMNLEMENYKVYLAKDGKEGLKLAEEVKPIVILLDIMMPTTDGCQTLVKLKADSTLANIPVLMLTAKTGASDVVKALEIGANDYLKNHLTLRSW